MRKRDLLLTLLATVGGASLANADGVLPGICVSSKQPVHVYLNSKLVCENSLSCAIMHLRPSSGYHIEVRTPFDPKARPLFSDEVRTPQRGMQTVVVQSGPSLASQTLKQGSDADDLPSAKDMVRNGANPRKQPKPTKAELASAKNPLISEDAFADFMQALESASPEQMKWLIEGRLTQNAFLVQHVKQIVEMHTATDKLRLELIKKMYPGVADRENAFTLMNSIRSGELQNSLASYIAEFNASHPQ